MPSVPDDRSHVSAVLGTISGATGAAGVGMAATGIGAPAAPVLGTISGLTGFAAAITVGVVDVVDSAHSDAFKAHAQQFRAIYAKEADYRKREVA